MNRQSRKITLRIGAVLFLVIFVAIFTRCGSSQTDQPSKDTAVLKDTLEVHFIDVGQGDSILIEENDNDMLIDAGENTEGTAVVEYLKSENIKELDYVIGTHPHSDHIGGLDTVLTAIPAKQVILPDTDYKTKTYDDVLEVIKESNIKETEAKTGDRYRLGLASFTIVAPCSSDYKDVNNYSVCIRLTYGSTSFLLTGDAEALSEREMLENGEALSADVLKLGHHGSAYSCCEDFLDAVHPAYAIISVGKDNEYGHPSESTLQTMLNRDITIYRTDEQGTIIFTSDGNHISVN